jgi:hypothetical protein
MGCARATTSPRIGATTPDLESKIRHGVRKADGPELALAIPITVQPRVKEADRTYQMKLFSFESKKKLDTVALTPDSNGANLPVALAPWVRLEEVTINRGERGRIIADSDEILDGIERDGYFLAAVKVDIRETVVPAPSKK